MFCKHISTVMEFDKSTFEMSRVPRQHPILQSDRYIRCTQCDSRWCCTECCVEDDSMDLPTFNRIYDCTEEPSHYDIVCCKCSGNKPGWKEEH